MSLLRNISTAAAQAGLTAGTLRSYERLGLLTPARDSNGNRLYSDADVSQAKKIAAERQARVGSGLRRTEAAA